MDHRADPVAPTRAVTVNTILHYASIRPLRRCVVNLQAGDGNEAQVPLSTTPLNSSGHSSSRASQSELPTLFINPLFFFFTFSIRSRRPYLPFVVIYLSVFLPAERRQDPHVAQTFATFPFSTSPPVPWILPFFRDTPLPGGHETLCATPLSRVMRPSRSPPPLLWCWPAQNFFVRSLSLQQRFHLLQWRGEASSRAKKFRLAAIPTLVLDIPPRGGR